MSRSAYQLDSKPEVGQRWEDLAACKGGGWLGDPDAWFIVTQKTHLVERPNQDALFICQNACPVLAECREATLAIRQRWAVRDEIRGGWWFDGKGNGHEREDGGGSEH